MAIRSRSWRPTETATPPRSALDRIAYRKQMIANAQPKATATVAALGSRAPLIYGRVQVQGLIGAVTVAQVHSATYLTLLAVWGEGEITAIEGLVTSGEPSTIERIDYLGTATQSVDPWLATYITDYADTLRGTYNNRSVSLAYSVLKIGTENFPEAPTAVIRGLQIYDPRTGLWAYSTNPALILADVLTRAGETVDWTNSLAAINYCDDTVGVAPDRWTCSLVINNPADVYEHVEMLRAYAHCLIDHTATGIRLVPDQATSVTRAITASDIVAGSLTLSRPARRDTPTYVRVSFTDTAPPAGTPGGPWGTAYAATAHPGIVTNEVPWIEAGIAMPGIQKHQEASRSAIERLNAYTLRNLYAECVIRDEGLALAVGDVVTLTHPIGVSDKPMRVLAVDDQEPGRYKLRLEEYDPAVYSNAIVDEPTYPDTSLLSPFDVPAPISLTAEEDIYRLPSGTYATRLLLTWDGDAYPYAKHYEARVRQGGKLCWSVTGQEAEAMTTEVIQGASYEIQVRIVSEIGITGPWASLGLVVAVINYPPTDVPGLYAMEVGGEVRLSWPPASDTDIWRYEVRWSATTEVWDNATLLDRIDGLRLTTRDIPVGTWRFRVRAMDAIGQYSATNDDSWADVTVTSDAASFFVGTYTATSNAPGSVNMFFSVDRFSVSRAWSETNTVVNAVFTGVANTYSDLACTYAMGSASSIISNSWNMGTTYTGTLTASWSKITAVKGTITKKMQTSTNGSSFTTHATNPVTAAMAYARTLISADANNGILLRSPPILSLNVNTMEESGIVTTLASGAKTVTLTRDYSSVTALIVSADSTSARTAVYDNIVLGNPTTFDVYLFTAAGAQVAGTISYRFKGV
jgi:hypothetical protein